MDYKEFTKALKNTWRPFLQARGYEGREKRMSRELPEFYVTVVVRNSSRERRFANLWVEVEPRCIRGQAKDLWNVHDQKLPYCWDGRWKKDGGEETVQSMIEAFRGIVEPRLEVYAQPDIVDRLAELSVEQVAAKEGLPPEMSPWVAASIICWALDQRGDSAAAAPFRERWDLAPNG